MFSEMVQRSEQLFFSPVESADDRLLFHLPSFLEALASIVKEMEEVKTFLLSPFVCLGTVLFSDEIGN